MEHLDENGLLPKAQHGFRAGHSTVTALVKSLSQWTEGKRVAIASFDYSATFDTIDRKTVQERLDDIGASPGVKKWMASYMDNGKQRVRWNSALSDYLTRKHGVAQGSKAGPLIFILVTMVNFALLTRALAYADDTHTSSNSVQELIKESDFLVDLSSQLHRVFYGMLHVYTSLTPSCLVFRPNNISKSSSTRWELLVKGHLE